MNVCIRTHEINNSIVLLTNILPFEENIANKSASKKGNKISNPLRGKQD